MACHQGSDTIDSSKFIVCELCEEGEEAKHHCDDCLSNFCDRCAQSHGKLKLATRGVCHRMEEGACAYDMELELCPLDGQKMSFYCLNCRLRVCAECEMNRKKHVLHSVVSLTRHVGLEKEKLLDKLDDVTTKTETISHLPDDIQSMSIQIELKWLERKELMRQEFASLLDTLTTQQQKLLADMDEEVKRSLERLNQLQQDHDTVLSDTCQLSDECISAVQNLPRDQFINSYPLFVDSVKHLENKVERMASAKDQMPAFLRLPFSLYKEKLHLHHCLQSTVFNLEGVKAREHHRFVPKDRLKEELSLHMLLETPTSSQLTPSSTLRYNVNIFCGSKQKKKPVWSSKKPLKAVDIVINGNHGHKLLPGNLYMVKIHPVITCTSHLGDQSVEGRVICIVIITDTAVGSAFEPVMAAGDSYAIADTCSLLNSAFEDSGEDNLPCINVMAAGNKNNSNRAREQSHKINSYRLREESSKKGSYRTREQSQNKQNKNFTSKSVIDPFISPPVVRHGERFPLWESIPVRACYKCMVPTALEDRSLPVPAEEVGGALCVQRRYLSDCCFEEARLMEDSSLRVSRVVLFDR